MEPFGFTAKLLGDGRIKNIKVKKPKGLKKKHRLGQAFTTSQEY